ncbi:Protein of unknown function [Pyronema omphalodes CBS 100304]|uniref:Uncharacterized protein n=1 Tax=Pyronema omphalodes (strain CBS 100304) TaxID=1076935 RepID=U4LUC7_PYROM|nr:Protein of unknown function [Pyronema omphalodes CBS 100304]
MSSFNFSHEVTVSPCFSAGCGPCSSSSSYSR